MCQMIRILTIIGLNNTLVFILGWHMSLTFFFRSLIHRHSIPFPGRPFDEWKRDMVRWGKVRWGDIVISKGLSSSFPRLTGILSLCLYARAAHFIYNRIALMSATCTDFYINKTHTQKDIVAKLTDRTRKNQTEKEHIGYTYINKNLNVFIAYARYELQWAFE